MADIVKRPTNYTFRWCVENLYAGNISSFSKTSFMKYYLENGDIYNHGGLLYINVDIMNWLNNTDNQGDSGYLPIFANKQLDLFDNMEVKS